MIKESKEKASPAYFLAGSGRGLLEGARFSIQNVKTNPDLIMELGRSESTSTVAWPMVDKGNRVNWPKIGLKSIYLA